jgi:hypothetical protein
MPSRREKTMEDLRSFVMPPSVKAWIIEVNNGRGWTGYSSAYYTKRLAKRHARQIKAEGLADRARVRELRENKK